MAQAPGATISAAGALPTPGIGRHADDSCQVGFTSVVRQFKLGLKRNIGYNANFVRGKSIRLQVNCNIVDERHAFMT